MEEQTDSRRTREDVIRYWTPRVVAIALGLIVGLAWFWPGGPDVVAFLANWSTFCIQAGAIYLFVFEREFLANLVVDFLEFVRRLREYRERRAAEQAAAQEAARRARAEAAARPSTATPAASRPAPSAVSPVDEAQKPGNSEQQSSSTAPLVKPRFRSRDGAFGFRAIAGLLFLAVIGALFITGTPPQGEKTGEQDDAPAERPVASQPSAAAAQSSVEPSTQMHTIRGGESCWSVAADIAQAGERIEPLWLRILAANPQRCSTQRERALRPGTILVIPDQATSPTEG